MNTSAITGTIPTRAGTVSAPGELTADRVTKSLLGYGVLAGPVYVAVSSAQAVLREGFDPARHAWSQLALGEFGWVQVANFVLSGAMVIAFAVGLRRALRSGPAALWAPVLIGVFGLSMVVAGIFPVDAGGGFPAGVPAPAAMSAGALVHLASGAVGFPCLAAGLWVLARRLGREGFTRLAAASRITGAFFLASFAGMASGALGGAGIPVFTAGAVSALGLLAVLAVHRYRQMPDTNG
ncbi:DUF998 domain-containing protein [Allonocardiopsis opalescens]|uniref:Uncharacterized protein DUF998 n=1 Tax=Allonocardiopsis opalescens TaxID=1144618 RepID=A0A2T0PYP5_9ACTN|nr:DUF998 domain-containing protein [Allonocardiopsis opalescens]PRX96632.1 uncharacterized protein DUF998 [Allonocardiopsis opalescens]